jgi:acetyl esterase/lipase
VKRIPGYGIFLPTQVNRREFITISAGTALAATTDTPRTYTYKTAEGCDIQADVYGAEARARKPVVIWIHGGALILGSRKSVPAQFKGELLKQGFVVVSIDYRLAPETKLPAIIEDVRDAHRWVRKSGPKLFQIDPDRLAVAGGSAGGYLTEMSGFAVNPRPRALVSYYGYGDITLPWYSRPDPFYRKQPLVSKEEAMGSVGKVILSEPAEKNQRGRFYLYCRQQGIWPKEVGGHDPDRESKWFDRYCPIRNVSAKYPPLMLIHGTEDTDVPYDESKRMDEKLTQTGVKHEFITVTGAGHGLSGAKPEETARIAERAVEFVKAHTS